MKTLGIIPAVVACLVGLYWVNFPTYSHRYRLTIADGWEAPGRFALELKDLSTGQRCEVLLRSSGK